MVRLLALSDIWQPFDIALTLFTVHLREHVHWYEHSVCKSFQKIDSWLSGVVVESFSYVFQATDGSKAITRAQMRAFKKVWATYANPKTARLDRENLVAFLGVRHIRICVLDDI